MTTNWIGWTNSKPVGPRSCAREFEKTRAGYVEALDGSVAAEVISACQGNQPGDLPENVASWATVHGAELGPEDVELAVEAVERVAGEESKLAELWDDADGPEWRESLGELSERLRAALW